MTPKLPINCIKILMLITLSLFLCSGCSTIFTHSTPSDAFDFGYYNGIRLDYGIIAHTAPGFVGDHTFMHNFSWDAYAVIDFPFSLVGDTLFLPIDACLNE